ncbi:EamA family transporter [Candidatus Woesearchaeota archaeon]|nr:EamA family transporter [Candidatus Woesearchaeota archaeon]
MNKGYAYITIAALTWSSLGIFVRSVSLSGLQVYFFMSIIASLIFGFLLLREKKLSGVFDKRHIWLPLCVGLSGAVTNVAYFYAYNLTTIANSTFVHYLAPVLISLLAPIMLSEKNERKVWYSTALAFLGLFVLLSPQRAAESLNLLGILSAFISAVAYAFNVLLFKKASGRFDEKQIVFSQVFFSFIILLPFVLYREFAIQPADILPLLVLGILHQGIAVLLFIKALKMIPVQRASVITYLEPVGAVILAAIFLKEIPGILTLIGGSLILAACYFVVKKG